jgi:alpha-glucosidase
MAFAGTRIRPRFSREGRIAHITVPLGPRVSLYGTGEQAGPLLRSGTTATLWNYDAYDFTEKTPSLYQSHPFVLGVHADGSAFGVIIETTRRCIIELRAGIRVRVEGPAPAVVIIERDHPAKVVQSLAELTGFMPLPPRWATGYHQCRFSYESDAVVREVADGFRSRGIPCDAIWLDIDCMDEFRSFTLHPRRFPDPATLIEELRSKGIRVVMMVDPGLKVDPTYFAYREGAADHHFVTHADGSEYQGHVWPGQCAFPDFTRKATRAWFGDLYAPLVRMGIAGFWNDMNEPAVFFPAFGKTMPPTVRHRADPELGGAGDHALHHNIYGMQMSRATREGLERHQPQTRPFVLTRASFLGGQRYAAAWTGDNRASEAHMRWSLSMTLNLGLSGQPFSGPDIGGFIDNTPPDLFARWMGLGTMLPFCRAHKTQVANRHEPWSLGRECEATCKRAIERRYRLMPYLSTLFWIAATQGLPIARPVFFADPSDPRLRAEDGIFLLGADLLVEPVWERPLPVARPKGTWREFDPLTTRGRQTLWDPLLPRLRAREGSIIPLGPVTPHTTRGPFTQLTLIVSPDAHGNAEGLLYEDEGDGYAHREGEFLLTRYRAFKDALGWTVEVASSEGRWARPERQVNAIVLADTPRAAPHEASGLDGATLRLAM